MPFGNSLHTLRRTPEWQPFGEPPVLAINSYPIDDGHIRYSSSGMSIMGSLPKSPGDLLKIIAEQYEPVQYHRGRELRGGKGKKKGKQFFKAHLRWYGVEYHGNESRDALENLLEGHLRQRPAPDLANEWYQVEPIMRARYLGASASEEARLRDEAVERAAQGDSSLLESLDDAATDVILDIIDEDPNKFFCQYFTSSSDVVVLRAVDETDRLCVLAYAPYFPRLKVVEVECSRSRRGGCCDLILGTSSVMVARKAAELRRGPY